MNRSLETALRFVNLTPAGLLAGSLGFGEAALVPGWQHELSRESKLKPFDALKAMNYFNAIGPVALARAVRLAVRSARSHWRPGSASPWDRAEPERCGFCWWGRQRPAPQASPPPR